MNCVSLRLGALVLASSAVSAQLSSTVGPPVAPTGCAVTITISNDTAGTAITNLCPYKVFDQGGGLVLDPFCFPVDLQMPAGGTFTAEWLQEDGVGAQVPPGLYTIEVTLPDSSVESHVVEVSATAQAGLSMLGAAKTGTTREFQLCSPGDPGGFYFMAASLSSVPGTPSCAGIVPLTIDPAFNLSVNPTSPIFLNFTGNLDADGLSLDPALAVPDSASFVGLSLVFGYTVLDFFQPCFVITISEPLTVTIT